MFCYGFSVELGGSGEEAEDVTPQRRLVKEVSGLVKDGLSQHSKGERFCLSQHEKKESFSHGVK